MSALWRVVEFQAAWWATALLARAGHGWLAVIPTIAFCALHLARSPSRAASLLLAAAAAVLGAVVDGVLARIGSVAFPAALAMDVCGWPVAPFMVGLWAAFACTLEAGLAGLARRPFMGLVVGALGGVLAYRGGAGLDVLLMPSGLGALVSIGVAWGLATPILGAISVALQSEVAARRARTIPILLLLGLAFLLALPVLLPAALVIDVVRALLRRRPFMSLRVLSFGTVYLVAEFVGLSALAFVWGWARATSNQHRLVEWTYAVQLAWTSTLFAAVQRIFSLRFVVDGDGLVRPGPVVVLVRHASIIDTLLPSTLLSRTHGVRLRFVLKKELLSDPCLDVAGNRLPNHFVARRAEGTAHDTAAIETLARGMSSTEGALIYPEGTRFTPLKLQRALAELSARHPELAARAHEFRQVLPPKTTGVFALLDGNPKADALFLAHHGLEGTALVADIWSGGLLGRTVHVACWRVARAQIPDAREARTDWLYDEWLRMDAWIARYEAGDPIGTKPSTSAAD